MTKPTATPPREPLINDLWIDLVGTVRTWTGSAWVTAGKTADGWSALTRVPVDH